MIEVVIIDDHALVRSGFRMILQSAADIQVIAEAGNGEDGLALIRKQRPDVALVDIHLPGCSGLELTERVRRADIPTRIVVLTVIEDSRLPKRLLKAGAAGYLTKGCAAEELVHAVRLVAQGQRYLAPSVAQRLALDGVDGGGSPFEALSQRELEVAIMLARGDMIKHIGERLHLSPKTISTYKARLFDKLEIDNTITLARMLVTHGLGEDGTEPLP